MHKDYKNDVFRRLRDEQLQLAPREEKLAQLDRAEHLLGELDPEKSYSCGYLFGRLARNEDGQWTNSGHWRKGRMSGEAARHDLRLFVEDMSDAADVDARAAGEPVLTVEELSNQFSVSTKTISRWRRHGLVSRRFVFDGRKRVGFLKSSVERFVESNSDRVKRGMSFSQLNEEQRQEIIHRARQMAEEGACPPEVLRQVAQETGRSVETIRYTIKQHDTDHPRSPVFPLGGPLSDEAKRKIYQHHRRGTSVEALAKQYSRNKASIVRAINHVRAMRILELPLEFIPNETFDDPSVERAYLGPLPDAESASRRTRAPSGLPPYLASLYEVPLLTREQEQHLFRKFNYLKHKATKLRNTLLRDGELNPSAVRRSVLERIEKLYDQVVSIKNEIIRHNLRLVVSIAKRHVGAKDNFFELVSDGNMSLIRAVEKFDYARGNKFSTYASWAIMKNFARTIPVEGKHRERFRTSQQEAFSAAEDDRTIEQTLLAAQQARQTHVKRMLRRLDEREHSIIVSRFGLGPDGKPHTLKEVGQEMGVTKERVRQIEARAMNKLKAAAAEEELDWVDFAS